MSAPPPSWPPPAVDDGRSRPTRPDSRTIKLVGISTAVGLGVVAVCLRVARHRAPCDIGLTQSGTPIRDAACRAGQRFHHVIADWASIPTVIVSVGLLALYLCVPLISRRFAAEAAATEAGPSGSRDADRPGESPSGLR